MLASSFAKSSDFQVVVSKFIALSELDDRKVRCDFSESLDRLALS